MVSATVTSDPVVDPKDDSAALVSLSEYDVLAGSETNGPVDSIWIAVPASRAGVVLPQGKFILILAPVPNRPSTYIISDGVEGSFVIDGTEVTQRCANFDKPEDPLLAQNSVPLTVLQENVAKAIASN
jgi:hypothetical protein